VADNPSAQWAFMANEMRSAAGIAQTGNPKGGNSRWLKESIARSR